MAREPGVCRLMCPRLMVRSDPRHDVAVTTTPRPAEPILHVDLDAFYASVAVLKDPSLEGKPVIVGGTGARGVVTSASYEARRFGVRSAMPSVRARRLCPEGIFLPPDFDAYRVHSHRFREVLLAHTPLVEPISLDEAFLDVGGATRLFGSPVEIAKRIRREVAREIGVTCSVGIAPTKFVAKLASDGCKPDGFLHVPADGVTAYLEPLPVGRLWGVGEKTAELLGRLAIRTVGDLGRTPPTILERLIGAAAASHLGALARGVDDRRVEPYEQPKSIGHEETFDRDLDDENEILRELLALSGRARELHDAHPFAHAARSHRPRWGDPPDRVRPVSPPARGETTCPAARGPGSGSGLGGRAPAGIAAFRTLGRRGAHHGPDRASLRDRCGGACEPPRPIAPPFGTTRSGPLSIIGGERGHPPRPEESCRSTITSRRSWRRSNGASRRRIRGSSNRSPARTSARMPGVG